MLNEYKSRREKQLLICSSNLKVCAGEIAQQVMVPAANFDNPSSNPGPTSWEKERTNSGEMLSNLYMHTVAHPPFPKINKLIHK